jgi:hypothetical protein
MESVKLNIASKGVVAFESSNPKFFISFENMSRGIWWEDVEWEEIEMLEAISGKVVVEGVVGIGVIMEILDVACGIDVAADTISKAKSFTDVEVRANSEEVDAGVKVGSMFGGGKGKFWWRDREML